MSACELCGKETSLVKANVEGVIIRVCTLCSKYGNIIQEKQAPTHAFQREETVEDLTENFHTLIKRKREELGMTQQELAQKLSERASTLARIEQGSLTPNDEQTKKIEKSLGLKLSVRRLNPLLKSTQKTDAFTIGDLLKKKNE